MATAFLSTDKTETDRLVIVTEQYAGNVALPRRTRLHLRAVRKNQSELTPGPDNFDNNDCALAPDSIATPSHN